MERKIRISIIPVILIISCLSGGCGDDSKEKEQNRIQVNQSFPKIQEHGMELNIISTLASFRRKDPRAVMKFQFINEGLARVQIDEWKYVESENLKVQYAECPEEGGSVNLPESAWKDSPRRVTPGDCPRYPLELDPKSSIIFTMPLSFLQDLKKPGRYAVRGVMDLTSIDVKSTPMELIIK